MLTSTTETVPGDEVTETLGLADGTAVRLAGAGDAGEDVDPGDA